MLSRTEFQEFLKQKKNEINPKSNQNSMPTLLVKNQDFNRPQSSQIKLPQLEIGDKWDENYFKKTIINTYIEENKNLRARVWNIQKENRQMYSQLEQWGMEKFIGVTKPFVDSATLEKVYGDNHYQSVTLKQKKIHLESQYQEKVQEFEELQVTLSQTQKIEQIKLHSDELLREMRIKLNSASNYENLNAVKARMEKLQNDIQLQQDKNSVLQFQIDVQISNISKLQVDIDQYDSKIDTADSEIQKSEEHLNKMNVNLVQLQTVSTRKTHNPLKKGINIDELLAEKQKTIEEQNQKIESLKMQMQELLRTFIIQNQDLSKELDQLREDEKQMRQQILEYRIHEIKYNKMKEDNKSDMENNVDELSLCSEI